MGDEKHVIRVDGSERSKTITDDGEESDEDIIDDIDEVFVACIVAARDPPDEEQNPNKTKDCDEERIQRDEKAQGSSNVL